MNAPTYIQHLELHSVYRVANCALWFLKLPHSEAKEQVIFNVNILRGSSSVLELLGTIGNSVCIAQLMSAPTFIQHNELHSV